jgi:hypothetical protein
MDGLLPPPPFGMGEVLVVRALKPLADSVASGNSLGMVVGRTLSSSPSDVVVRRLVEVADREVEVARLLDDLAVVAVVRAVDVALVVLPPELPSLPWRQNPSLVHTSPGSQYPPDGQQTPSWGMQLVRRSRVG